MPIRFARGIWHMDFIVDSTGWKVATLVIFECGVSGPGNTHR
jgi:hypothetical protein